MHPDVLAVLKIDDPRSRAKEAGRIHEVFRKGGEELARVRREALQELENSGLSHTQIGELLGLSRQRVSQLLKSGPAPERAFLGTDTITVVVAGKVESERPDPQPVVAQDDLVAYDHFKQLAKTLGLDTTYEVVPTGGFVRLNRDNLMVLCGPRHSPNLREVIESDEDISFTKDEIGWHLVDNRTNHLLRSPMDSGKPRDYAYLARLPRPDGKGTFLYAAGIHAVGEAGAVHYLEQQLGEMYRILKQRRFSVIVDCEYDPKSPTREIVSSRLATEYYLKGN